MEMAITVVLVIAAIIAGFKIVGYFSRAEEYIDLSIREAIVQKRADFRENSQKRLDKMKAKYAKSGLIALEDIEDAMSSSFKEAE